VSPFDNALALDQIETAYATLLARPVPSNSTDSRIQALARDGAAHPRIVRSAHACPSSAGSDSCALPSLGGDHTIVLPILRALHRVYGPISVIHFDSCASPA
jgi:agmatinase